MPSPRRVVMLLVALAMLIGVATPPVIEDHVEVGFCSAIVRSRTTATPRARSTAGAERHPALAPVSIASARPRRRRARRR